MNVTDCIRCEKVRTSADINSCEVMIDQGVSRISVKRPLVMIGILLVLSPRMVQGQFTRSRHRALGTA